MKKQVKRILSLALTLVMVMSLAACGGGTTAKTDETPVDTGVETSTEQESTPVTLKVSHTNKEGGGTAVATDNFEAIVESLDSTISVDVYGNSQLGAESAVLESVLVGTVEMQMVSTSVLANVVPEAYVMNVPFLFDDMNQFWEIVQSDEFMEKFDAALAKAGLKFVGFINCNNRAVANNVREICTPADMKGLNIRVLEGAVYTDLFSALGCSTSIVAVTELYTALQQGMVDGDDCGISYLVPNQYAEVETYYTDTNHTVQPLAGIINLNVWNKLSADQQNNILEAMKQAGTEACNVYYSDYESYLETAETEYGMTIHYLTDEERQMFKDAAADVIEKYSNYNEGCREMYELITSMQ